MMILIRNQINTPSINIKTFNMAMIKEPNKNLIHQTKILEFISQLNK